MSRCWILIAISVPACGGGLEPCDIRQNWCQDDIFYATLDVRADTWDAWAKPPASRVISIEQYREYLEAGASLQSESYDLWDQAFTLVGMVDPEADLAGAGIESKLENTVAFYSPATRAVTIIDRGDPADETRDTETLAHEYVHFLQDRYDGLRAIEGYTLSADEWFGARSMVEGEAVMVSYLVLLGTKGRGFDDADWDATFDLWRGGIDHDVAVSPSRFTEALRRYVYPLGGQYTADAYAEGGPPAFERALYDPPRSALHVLGGPGSSTPALVELDCLAPSPAGYELEGEDSLGPVGVVALLNDNADAALAWWAQARTWRADNFRVFQSASETAVVWRSRWSSASRARALVATLQSRPLDWRLLELDTEVVITAATDPSVFDTWDPLACE